MELEGKQDVFRSLQDTAELLSLENHPAKQTVEVCDLTMCEDQRCCYKNTEIHIFLLPRPGGNITSLVSDHLPSYSRLFSSSQKPANSFNSLRRILRRSS